MYVLVYLKKIITKHKASSFVVPSIKFIYTTSNLHPYNNICLTYDFLPIPTLRNNILSFVSPFTCVQYVNYYCDTNLVIFWYFFFRDTSCGR